MDIGKPVVSFENTLMEIKERLRLLEMNFNPDTQKRFDDLSAWWGKLIQQKSPLEKVQRYIDDANAWVEELRIQCQQKELKTLEETRA